MLINCTNCHRSYDVDEAKAANEGYAGCSCGAVLTLHPGARGVAQIGRYTLVNQIAVGGMGEIWFALQQGSDGFEKEVVVKRLLPNYAADREVTAMLIKEAKVSSRLTHPNIVQVYDLVRQDGNYLIVMEYVPGITVKDLINACCRADIMPPWELSVYIVLQLLRGLGYAHRLPQRDKSFLTFIHRDISPQNLLICQNGTVKITDFGIAKALNEASNTAPGLIRGKTSYLSPERVRGGDVNEASDLFPAAIILFETWALNSLFRAENHEDTLRKLFETSVPPLADYRHDVSPALEAVMRTALHRRANERFPSARDFEIALIAACAPVTTEQIQAATSEFLQQHGDFFTSIETHKDGPEDAALVKRLRPTKVPGIDGLLRIPRDRQAASAGAAIPLPPPKKLRWWRPAAAAGLFILGFGTAFVVWGSDLWGPEAPAATLQEAVAPLAPTPSFAPSPVPSATPSITPSAEPESQASLVPAQAEGINVTSPNIRLGGDVEVAPAALAPENDPAAPASEPPVVDKPPRGRELRAYFRRFGPRLLACIKDPTEDIDTEIEIEIDASGHLSADISSAGLDEAYEACLNRGLERLRFRTFVGAPVTYTLPLHAEVTKP